MKYCHILAILLLISCSSPRQAGFDYADDAEISQIMRFDKGRKKPKKQIVWTTASNSSIKRGFLIEIWSPVDEEISGTFRVNDQGELNLPYDVTLNAVDKTLDQLKREINQEYSKFIRSPRISVSIHEKKYYIDVNGLVGKPGSYLVASTTSVEELFGKAGGLLSNGNQREARYVEIKDRSGQSLTLNLNSYFSGKDKDLLPRNWSGIESITALRDGDSHVNQSITLLGSINSPGDYPYEYVDRDNTVPKDDLFYYLIQAGGPAAGANLTNVTLLRPSIDGRMMTADFDLEDKDNIPRVKPGDTIMVYPEGASTVEKRSKVAGGIASIFTAIAAGFLAIFGL